MIKDTFIIYTTTIFTAMLAVFLLIVWFSITPKQDIPLRVPTLEGSLTANEETDNISFAGGFERFDGVPSSLRGSWPGFRGPGKDNISNDQPVLADSWASTGPPKRWSIDLGEGYAGPAILNGRVYILDYDEEKKQEQLRCFSLDDGREIWRRYYRIFIKRNHGMSRTVPAVTDEFVVTIGSKCHVMCVDTVTGDLLWGIDLVKDYNTTVPLWYTAQNPIIDDGIAIIAPGGTLLMMGVDCRTGDIVFEVPNPDKWQMSHASVMPMTLYGHKMYVYASLNGMIAVSADAATRGEVLFQTTEWNNSVIAPTPISIADNQIFVTAGYGAGSMKFQVNYADGVFNIEKVFTLAKEVFACEQQTPLFYKDHLLSILPGDAGPLKKQLVCIDTDGNIKWNSGKTKRFGLGPFLIANDTMFILDDFGTLTMAKATPEGYKELAQAKVLDDRDSWGPMAIVDGYLLLRDLTTMICLDLKKEE